MIRAVFDTNVLVSAFLTRHQPGGVSTELRRFVESGAIALFLSPAIIEETAATLARSKRLQTRYRYTQLQVVQYCADLFTVAAIIPNPPELPGTVERDPDDDKIVECAVAAEPEFLVTRDQDLLSLGAYGRVAVTSPEDLLQRLRTMDR